MTALVWDAPGTRVYETGIEKGVLYSPDTHVGIAWNGLVSVDETFNDETDRHYFNDDSYVSADSAQPFAGTMTAYTYPDEFLPYIGTSEVASGFSATQQPNKTFNLAYQTKVGNDTDPLGVGYKIHIFYGLIAIPADTTYDSIGDSTTPILFNWNLIGSLQEVGSGFRPTGHVIIDSRTVDPSFLSDIEGILYGSTDDSATLVDLAFWAEFLIDGILEGIVVIDNGDGTWTAYGPDADIIMLDSTTFEIDFAYVLYLDVATYRFVRRHTSGDTLYDVIDHGDGTWTADGSSDAITMLDSTTFLIDSPSATVTGGDTYDLSTP